MASTTNAPLFGFSFKAFSLFQLNVWIRPATILSPNCTTLAVELDANNIAMENVGAVLINIWMFLLDFFELTAFCFSERNSNSITNWNNTVEAFFGEISFTSGLI